MNESNIFDVLSNKENIQNNFSTSKNKELNDIILCLEYVINDINKELNKYYIIEEIENIIVKLKNYSKSIKEKKNYKIVEKITKLERYSSKPPSSGIATIELTKNLKAKYNYSPLRPKRNNSQDLSNYSYLTNSSSNIFNNNNNVINNYKKNVYLNNSSTKSLSPLSSRYNGIRINGKKEGKGIYYYPNGCKYEGYFKNDKKNGKGIFYYSNGDRYEGHFKEGNYEGNGIFYFNNGDRYEGNFERNKYSGKGKYYYHNGDYFEGYWMDDKKCGEGIYYYKNGDKIKGKYYNGKPYGIHIKYYMDGKNQKINY